MSTTEKPVEIDADKPTQFVFRAVDEVGATLNAVLVVIGDKLGLYRALAGTGVSLLSAELAERTGYRGALRPRMAQHPSGRAGTWSTTHPRAAATRYRPSRRWRSPISDSPRRPAGVLSDRRWAWVL